MKKISKKQFQYNLTVITCIVATVILLVIVISPVFAGV